MSPATFNDMASDRLDNSLLLNAMLALAASYSTAPFFDGLAPVETGERFVLADVMRDVEGCLGHVISPVCASMIWTYGTAWAAGEPSPGASPGSTEG